MSEGENNIDFSAAPQIQIKPKKNRSMVVLTVVLTAILVTVAGYIVYTSKNKNIEEKTNNQQNAILNNGSAPLEIEVKNKQVTGTE